MLIWDEANIAHIARHGVSPDEVEQVVQNCPIDLGQQLRNGERRFVVVGETDASRVLLVVLTLERPSRVVTAHPADRMMRNYYRTLKANRYGKNS